MGESAKIQTLHNNDTGEAIAPRTVVEAVSGLTEKLDGKADLVGGTVPAGQLPEMNYDEKGSAEAVKAELEEVIGGKQERLTGKQGQVVGFDVSGNAVAQDAPTGGAGYVKKFTANEWVDGTDDHTITIPAATHGMTGTVAMCIAQADTGRTWASIQTYATVERNNITLHCAGGYDGYAVLCLYA